MNGSEMTAQHNCRSPVDDENERFLTTQNVQISANDTQKVTNLKRKYSHIGGMHIC